MDIFDIEPFKFTDEAGQLCKAEYDAYSDTFRISLVEDVSFTIFNFDEVYDRVNRGTWKRLS
jgi:hypothetical protein